MTILNAVNFHDQYFGDYHFDIESSCDTIYDTREIRTEADHFVVDPWATLAIIQAICVWSLLLDQLGEVYDLYLSLKFLGFQQTNY